MIERASEMYNKNSFVQAPLGIIIHFREGAHIVFPPGKRTFHIYVKSLMNGETVFDVDVQSNPAHPIEYKTIQTYHIPWEIRITQNNALIFHYVLNLTGRPVCLNMLPGAMGDMVAWMPACANFARIYNSHVTIMMKREYIEMFESAYPEFFFISQDQYQAMDYFAVYPIGVWGYGNLNNNPTDFQKDNLIDHADNILLVHSNRQPPKIAGPRENCAKKYGRYVCISTRASKKMKQWNCDGGWVHITNFLKKNGYRVFCIDADNQAMPSEAEDFTGLQPLRNRIDLISGCEFFIGLASGLSWIAWACGRPVVMISNATEPWCEFETPYRPVDKSVCNGCYNSEDMRFNDFDHCPRNRDYICTKIITPERIIEEIKKIPGFNISQ